MQSAVNYLMEMSNLNKGLLIVLLVLIVYYAYKWYSNRGMMMQMRGGDQDQGGSVGESIDDRECMEGGAGSPLVGTLYYTDWCKYCTKAKPEWDRLMQDYHGKTINGKKVMITKVNCDEQPEVAEQENIKGYPTFKFKMNNKNYDYPDEPLYDQFKSFIDRMLS